MAKWTKEELTVAYPAGSVGVQVDDEFVPFTDTEYEAWLDAHVELDKPADDDLGA